jgi:hypothetical protein
VARRSGLEGSLIPFVALQPFAISLNFCQNWIARCTSLRAKAASSVSPFVRHPLKTAIKTFTD